MDILNFGPVLQTLIDIIVVDEGLRKAMQMRLVCKTFEQYIYRSIWENRILERRIKPVGGRVLVEYLRSYVVSNLQLGHHPATTIRDTLHFMHQKAPGLLSPEIDHVRRVCEMLVASKEPKPPVFRRRNELATDFVTGVSLNWRDYNATPAQNALALAALWGMPTLVSDLLKEKVQKYQTVFGMPAMLIIEHLDEDILALYLETWLAQQNPQLGPVKARDGYNARLAYFHGELIECAVRCGNLKKFDMVTNAALKNQRLTQGNVFFDGEPRTAEGPPRLHNIMLLHAVRRGQLDLVRTALARGADMSVTDYVEGGMVNALGAAVLANNLEIFRFLVEKGARLAKTDQNPFNNPFLRAIENDRISIIKYCLEAGLPGLPTPSTTKLEHSNPLWVAARYKKPEIVQILLDLGIGFEPDSQLDQELIRWCTTGRGGRRMAAVLDKYRDRKRSTST